MRAHCREASMDEIDNPFVYPFTESRLSSEFNKTCLHRKVQIADKKIVRLLLVLHELDESVAELGGLPDATLSELVSSAIVACGFLDPIEAWQAIAVILETIEMRDPMTEIS
jgi:hypothetical protein